MKILNIVLIIKKIEPTIRMINRRNRFRLFNLLTLAKDKLFLFYQALNEEGKKNELPTFAESYIIYFQQMLSEFLIFSI